MEKGFLPTKSSSFVAAEGKKTRRLLTVCMLASIIMALYVLTAYEFVPGAWRLVERRHPAFDVVGKRAFTSANIPGDPLNIAFVGSEAQLLRAMLSSGWYPADSISLKSSLLIAVDSVRHKPYADAPVSNLFVNGKRQDLAFEQAEGNSPAKRHHVRFWRSDIHDALDRPLWIGAATFDSGVGLSHTTGQITHHIAADVDQERDKLLADLRQFPGLRFHWLDSFQDERQGRNGGGDHFVTDGRLGIVEVQ
jgi:hypothetical protein